MNQEYLERMKQGIEDYLKDTGISQAQLAKKAGVSEPYIGYARAANWDRIPRGKDKEGVALFTTFSAQIANKIMKFLGLYDSVLEFENFILTKNVLHECKDYQEFRIVSGNIGSGKTTTATWFLKTFPKNTFLIRCAEDMSPKGFLVELATKVGVKSEGTKIQIRVAIQDRLKTLYKPLVAIDEAENMKPSTYGAIKSLADNLEGDCGITLLGANNYLKYLQNAYTKQKQHVSQVYSRFSASPCELLEFKKCERDANMKFDEYSIEGKALRRELFDKSNDFRELDRNIHRYLRDLELKQAA